MSDILDQDEVDALLNALDQGEIETADNSSSSSTSESSESKNISKYDFRRPDIISKDQLRSLQGIHKSFCRILSNSLSTQLRTIVDVSLVAVDSLTYGEFNMSLPNPTWINVFSLSPLEGLGILEINPSLAFCIIDRLMGGSGSSPSEVSPLTDIEQSIISGINNLCLEGLAEAWSNIANFDFNILEKEVNPQFVQIVAPGETVTLISCEMKIDDVRGVISICFPFVYLEPVMSSLSSQGWASSTRKKSTPDMQKSIRRHLEHSELSIKAIMGQSELSVKDILSLKVDDVILLHKKTNLPFEVKIQNKTRFFAKPGTCGFQKGVQLTEEIKEEE